MSYIVTSITLPGPQNSDMRYVYTVNDVSLPFGISLP